MFEAKAKLKVVLLLDLAYMVVVPLGAFPGYR